MRSGTVGKKEERGRGKGEVQMKFIKLHNDEGFEYHINPNQICVMHPISVADPEDGTALFLSASEDAVEVAETVEEIIRKIEEVEHGEVDR